MVDYASLGDPRQMRARLVLISVSTAMLLAVFALMFLEDYSSEARSIARNLAPAMFGFGNLLVCAGAIGDMALSTSKPALKSGNCRSWELLTAAKSP
jgi:hypothetical protein